MEDEGGLRLTGFTTKASTQEKKRMRFSWGNERAKDKARRQNSQSALYLFIRLGVCVLLFCGVLALRLSKGNESTGAMALLDKALNDGAQPQTGGLGKLRFVQIPSIIDVFAPSSKPLLPVEARSFSLGEDDTLLCLETAKGDTVYCPCAANVRAVGVDDAMGRFVLLTSADEPQTELYIYGLDTVAVEQGQPILQRDIIGKAEGQRLCVKVYVNGRPLEPAAYFDLGSLK